MGDQEGREPLLVPFGHSHSVFCRFCGSAVVSAGPSPFVGCLGAVSRPASETLGGPISRSPGRGAGRAPSAGAHLLGEGSPLVPMVVNPSCGLLHPQDNKKMKKSLEEEQRARKDLEKLVRKVPQEHE